MRFQEIWIQYSASKKIRFIAEHKLSVALGEVKYKSIIKRHAHFGCDVTSNVGTKEAELKNLPENFLKEFGESSDSYIQGSYQEAEKYLIKEWCSRWHGSAFEKLRKENWFSRFHNILLVWSRFS